MLDVASDPVPAHTVDRPLLLVKPLQLRRAEAGARIVRTSEDSPAGWVMVLARVALTALFLGS